MYVLRNPNNNETSPNAVQDSQGYVCTEYICTYVQYVTYRAEDIRWSALRAVTALCGDYGIYAQTTSGLNPMVLYTVRAYVARR